jgi:dihydroorotate dehydrogenase
LNQEFCVVDKRLHQKICGIDFCNPVGLAAGFDKNGNAANIWKDFGFGFAEIGTVTKFAQSGNPKPRLFRLAKEQAALNRMGFNNNGAENLVKNFLKQNVDLKKHRKNNCLGINFGKSKITSLSKATEDYLTSLKLLIPYCDYAVINVSSPNTEGLRKLQDPILLKELLREVKNLDNCPPLFVKIAPDLSYKDIEDICQLIIDENIDGIIATNTSLDRLGFEQRKIKQTGLLLSEENGGLSGKPLQQKANQIIRHIHNIDNNINLIGVGGIDSPESAWERICSGASLVQIYTGWIYKGPQLVPNILNGILKQINIHQLSNVREAIGSNLEWIE